MCGRFEIHSAREIIAKVFQLGPAAFDIIPNYNVAPGQDVAMVVNIPKKDGAAWLDPVQHDPAKLQQLLTPRGDADLELYDVSPKVNSAKNNTPDLIRPVS